MSDSVDDVEAGAVANPFVKAQEPEAEAEAPKAAARKPRGTKAAAADLALVDEPKKSAAQREGEDAVEMVELEFHGEKFKLPADQEDWPILATQAFSKGWAIDGIEHILGRGQWARFVNKFPRKRQFNEFSDLIAEEFGFGTAGN